jgi:transcriptional regulator with XRE-family HTH domain
MAAASRSREEGGAEPQTQRATDADRHVGHRIRERRVMLGLSQQQLAQLIGVTYQQAHKYERGLNRISAGRLFEISQALGVPIAWFFEGLEEGGARQEASPRQRLCLEIVRNFTLIEDEKHREALSQMARALALQAQIAAEPVEGDDTAGTKAG